MSLQINIDRGTRPSPQIVAANSVVDQARSIGSPNASRALAVTVPICRIDQSGLQYEQQRIQGQDQFRFQTGVLRLILRQSILIANNISDCAQNIWAEHEQDHVGDNQEIMGRMEQPIRAHRDLQSILITPQWRPSSEFTRVQETISSAVADIFRDLTRAAVSSRDTDATYTAIEDRIRRQCSP